MAGILCVQVGPERMAKYRELLEPRGFALTFSPGGMAVADLLQPPPHVILIELRLPDVAGVEFIRLVRRHPQGTRVVIIALAAGASEDQIYRTLAAGADDFLPQDVRTQELLAKLRISLARRMVGTNSIAAKASVTFEAGTILANRFEILAAVAPGGFSHVYRARDVSGKWPGALALKVFRATTRDEDDERFTPQVLREAAKLASVKHPNIVKFYDLGYNEQVNYMVTEFAEGETLERILKRRGRLTEAEVVHVGYEVACALEYLHEQRILHRDIKPNNIMISSGGGVKIIDFGLAMSYGEHTISETADDFHGTPEFVAPERIRGGTQLDSRSDLYSLGVTLYYAASGKYPFSGASPRETMQRHLEDTLVPLQELVPSISMPLSQLITRMLAKEPDNRASLAEVVPALCSMVLAQGAGREPAAAVTPPMPPTTDASSEVTTTTPAPTESFLAFDPYASAVPAAAPPTDANAARVGQ